MQQWIFGLSVANQRSNAFSWVMFKEPKPRSSTWEIRHKTADLGKRPNFIASKGCMRPVVVSRGEMQLGNIWSISSQTTSTASHWLMLTVL
jgi:hypothetical protein